LTMEQFLNRHRILGLLRVELPVFAKATAWQRVACPAEAYSRSESLFRVDMYTFTEATALHHTVAFGVGGWWTLRELSLRPRIAA